MRDDGIFAVVPAKRAERARAGTHNPGDAVIERPGLWVPAFAGTTTEKWSWGSEMPETRVTFPSDGLKLAGVVRVPEGVKPGERRPAWIVMHGFGSNMNSNNVLEPVKMFERLGYVTLRFDMRGCGESEGERGRVICLEQVADASNALTFLAQHKQVEGDRIGMIGSSFGAAVAVYVGGV